MGMQRQVFGVALAAVMAAALSGCGGGGSGSEDSFFGVTGWRASTALGLSVPYTVCINGSGFIDPNTAEGQAMGARLAAYYQLSAPVNAVSGQAYSCVDHYKSVNVLLSMDDYRNRIATAAPGPAPVVITPAPTVTPITPRTCVEGQGTGLGTRGLELSGPYRFDGLAGKANTTDAFNLDPGSAKFVNAAYALTAVTGSLRYTFWAVAGSYSGGSITGDIIARESMNAAGAAPTQLRNGQTMDFPYAEVTGMTPKRGSYCMVVTLEEYNAVTCTSADKYCIVDWAQFPTAVQFE